LGLFAGLLFLSSCTGVTLSIQFDQIDGLKQDDPVIFKSTPIGSVKTITYTKDADFLVSIKIQDDFAHAVTEDTRFYIDVSPLAATSKAIMMEQTTLGGKKLASGTTVQGSSKETIIPPARPLDALGQTLEKMFTDMLTHLEKIQESDQYKTLKKKLSNLQTQLESSGKDMQESIRKDILPKLEQQLKKIIESLEQQGRKEEARELEKDFGRLQDI
jgi:ABC-type transporter Mla subunit MlaD